MLNPQPKLDEAPVRLAVKNLWEIERQRVPLEVLKA